jgi:hypothetical protein
MSPLWLYLSPPAWSNVAAGARSAEMRCGTAVSLSSGLLEKERSLHHRVRATRGRRSDPAPNRYARSARAWSVGLSLPGGAGSDGGADDCADAVGDRHHECAPHGHTCGGPELVGPAESCPGQSKCGKGNSRDHDDSERAKRSADDHGGAEWQDRAGGERKRRRAGRLERPSTPIVREAKLVSNMRGGRISLRESLGDPESRAAPGSASHRSSLAHAARHRDRAPARDSRATHRHSPPYDALK